MVKSILTEVLFSQHSLSLILFIKRDHKVIVLPEILENLPSSAIIMPILLYQYLKLFVVTEDV